MVSARVNRNSRCASAARTAARRRGWPPAPGPPPPARRGAGARCAHSSLATEASHRATAVPSVRSAWCRSTCSPTHASTIRSALHGIGHRAAVPRGRDDLVQLAGEPDLLAERGDPPLEGQRADRDPPAVAGRADDVRRGGDGAVEEHLVELRRAGDLRDRPHLDPRLVHGHEQVRQALPAARRRVGAGQHEAPVGDVGQRRPHLLSGDPPDVAVEDRRASARRRGRSRRRVRSSPGTRAPRRGRSAAGTGGFCSSVP